MGAENTWGLEHRKQDYALRTTEAVASLRFLLFCWPETLALVTSIRRLRTVKSDRLLRLGD